MTRPAGEQEVAAVAAATVVLLRDAPPAHAPVHAPVRGRPRLETLLLERHLDSDFFGGAYVFPGGKVDEADRRLEAARWTGPPLADRQQRLGAEDDADALGLLVTAVRETFEEAGVLLARRADGTPLHADDLATASFVEARDRLSRRGAPWDWRAWLADEALVLDLGALALWSWWVTPLGSPKRYDTRFFVARLPAGQVAGHDDVEMTALRWLTPQQALHAQARGEVTIVFPTRRNLAALVPYRTAEAAWTAATEGAVDQRCIVPTLVEVAGRRLVQHPFGGDLEPI